MQKYSTHNWTFSNWIPNFQFIENLEWEKWDKCPNCDSLKFVNWKCSECWYDIYYSKIEPVIKKAKKITDKVILKNYCECWNEIKWNYVLCKDCYNKYKTNWEFFLF